MPEPQQTECKDFALVIPLTHGLHAMVDLEDYDKVARFKWHAFRKAENTPWYARRCDHGSKKGGVIWMHRSILGLKPSDPRVDHRNRDGLDNRRDNLRCATVGQNAANRGRLRTTTAPYKGIRFVGKEGVPEVRSWGAEIGKDGKSIWLGSFWTAIDAAKAYDDAAKRLFGEFAYLNFPED